MSVLIKTKSEIRDFFNADEFVEATCSQINKDLHGISEYTVNKPASGLNPLDELCRQLTVIFVALDSLEKLAQFSYRVDLKENEFRENLEESQWEELAFFVVRREAQKVFLRQHFKT